MKIGNLLLSLLLLNFACTGNTIQTQHPLFIFVHGLFDNHTQADPFQEILQTIGNYHVISFDFEDAWYPPFIQSLEKPFKSSLGQKNEIEALHTVYQEVIDRFEQCNISVPPIVLIGVSRGASLVINFLATKKPKYVVAAICESPFDTLEHVLEIRVPKCKDLALMLFKNYDINGIKPAQVINEVESNIPLMFVASKEDTSVPYQLTVSLYELFIATEKRPYSKLVVFQTGKHAKLAETHKIEYTKHITDFLVSLGCINKVLKSCLI